MLLKNYPMIMSQTNKTLTKLIEKESYIVAMEDNTSPFTMYNVYVKEKLVGTISANPVCCIYFISKVKEYGDVIIYNKEFSSYSDWRG